MNILKFKPIYLERIWGEKSLNKYFNRDIPQGKHIGESWDISDRQEANSIALSGKFASMPIRQIIKENSAFIMGENWDKNAPFPILVKWLDCSEKLSIQVHPNKDIANKFNGEAKTECWYIYKSSSKLIGGFKKAVSKQEFIDSIENGTTKDLVHSFEAKEGDAFFVPSGRIHCINAGTLILEIQENSDTTYRVYDWNRIGLDGKKRELHIEEAIESIDFQDVAPQKISTKGKDTQLCDCPQFSLRSLNLKTGDSLQFKAREQARVISIVEGALESSCGAMLNPADSAILPYAQEQHFTAKQDTLILITENFAK